MRLIQIGLAAACVIVAACGSPTPSASSTPSVPAATASAAPASGDPAGGSICQVDLTLTGDIEGEVHGPTPGAARAIGSSTVPGVSVDVSPQLQIDGKPVNLAFSVWDADGASGPKPVSALMFSAEPHVGGGWTAGRDRGQATVADDGSEAAFDLELQGILGERIEAIGTFTCPPLDRDPQA